MRVVVIGAGMSGILCGVRLQQEGFRDIAIYEKSDGVGGTWRDNRYPGLSCDVPSHVYRYSFEPNPDWSHVFSPGPEIRAYFEGVSEKYGVDGLIHTGKEVTSCVFEDGRWRIGTADGGQDVADIVIAATGVLHQPYVPELPGLESFAGRAFHSARWDPEAVLDGRRVGVIGTGSTAVQIVSAVTPRVAHLALFQRTAQWVLAQENPAYSEEDRQRFRAEPELMETMHRELGRSFEENFSNAVIDASSERMRAIQELCEANLQSVRDPELRRRLTPDYRAGCKRLVIADGFYEALQEPHAELVSEAIERIEPAGVRTGDGRLHELDVLVLATGFQAHAFVRPMDVIGPGGTRLEDAWSDGPRAYRSVSVPGFPNFFMLIGPHSPVGNFSLIDIAELQLGYVLQLIDAVEKQGCRWIEAKPDATARFNAAMSEATAGTIWVTGCRSWYLDEKGIPATWPWTMDRFRREMARPDLGDFRLGG